ncbi:MAG: NAD-dependent epimerase/dehydratase family protein [Gammaproteobacteria bacterium]|nr:NAD-dependent epimerase/dehydratase family protein [Gammaproteobacteria bacterium]
MKVGIIGCCLLAYDVIKITRYNTDIEIIGIVDENIDKASDFANRFGIQNHYSSIDMLLSGSKLDVIYVLTPPQKCFELSKMALESGVNVFVKTPHVLDYNDANELIEIAKNYNVSIVPINSYVFSPVMFQVRKLIESGFLGDVLNIRLEVKINISKERLKQYVAPNIIHWAYDLPGGVLHNYLYQPLSVIVPYLKSTNQIQVDEKISGLLHDDLSDKLIINISDEKINAVMNLSLSTEESSGIMFVEGSKYCLRADIETGALVKLYNSGRFNKNRVVIDSIKSHIMTLNAFIKKVITKKKKNNIQLGLEKFVNKSYDSIKTNNNSPVKNEDVLKIIKTISTVVGKIQNKHLNLHNYIPDIKTEKYYNPSILVTGATSFLGINLVENLIANGYHVRALARKLSRIKRLKDFNIEIYYGDVADINSLTSAFKNIDIVIHAAADTIGNKTSGDINTVLGTQNIVDLCKRYSVKKLIYISSCSVYSVANLKPGTVIDENYSLEKYPEKRGYYSYSKMIAEDIVTKSIKSDNLNVVCLRPGTYLGPGNYAYSPIIGMSIRKKIFIIIGNGKLILPLVYYQNVINAILTVIQKEASTGNIYNVIDDNPINKKQYVNKLLKRLYPNSIFIYFPYTILYATIFVQEWVFKSMKKSPILTRYRLVSSQNNITYSADKLKSELGWKPPFSLDDAFEKIIDYEKNNKDSN